MPYDHRKILNRELATKKALSDKRYSKMVCVDTIDLMAAFTIHEKNRAAAL